MFKESHVTRLEPFTCIEEAAACPPVLYPALVGTGPLAAGLDATGFQALTDRLGPHYSPHYAPFHYCQADTYLLHEGMISSHLWDDEECQTGKKVSDRPETGSQVRRNFLPLGWLDFEVELDGRRWRGDELRPMIRQWRREWHLDRGVLITSYDFCENGKTAFRIEVEAFAPLDGEAMFFRLRRTICNSKTAPRLAVSLRLTMRAGLPIFDQSGAVTVDGSVLRATIDQGSKYAPVEPYTVVYGIGATGMECKCSRDGWTAILGGTHDAPAEGWLKVDSRRLAGETRKKADALVVQLKAEAGRCSEEYFTAARNEHARSVAAFWSSVADIEVSDSDTDDLELRRAWMLHLSEWLLRCGNDHRLGGTVQFLLMHQNGWKACNFHDHRYIIDGILRANFHDAAIGHVRWMLGVMSPKGRAFPWMMTYDGFSPVPPEQDRAPMSDANRALLAAAIYELTGEGRDELLREVVYPIVRRVADYGLEAWFYRHDDGSFHLRGVENDVMNETPREDEPGTVAMYISVMRKALAYARELGVDEERCRVWLHALDNISLPRVENRFAAWRGAPADQVVSPWFADVAYIAEWSPGSDMERYLQTCDHYDTHVRVVNRPWLQAANASRMIRLDQPERAGQEMADNLLHCVHGPGYFEECLPVGCAAMPPFASAHGSHLTASCEQIVLPDFWSDRIWFGRGMSASMRTRRVRFHSLRANKGVIASGEYTPRHWEITLEGTGYPVALDCLLRIPTSASDRIEVTVDACPAEWAYEREFIRIRVQLDARQTRRIRLVSL